MNHFKGSCIGHIGFTGTGQGMTAKQKVAVARELLRLKDSGAYTFHHGDCVGADSEAHDMADNCGYDIVIHPPINPKSRANRVGKTVLEPKEYLERNQDIVDSSERLIAAPKENVEQMRSGTWSTIRRAQKAGIPIKIIYPDGSSNS